MPGIQTDKRVSSQSIQTKTIMLRTDLDFKKHKGVCSYSLDGTNWMPLGGEFELAYDWRTGTFQGEQFAIFCYNPNPSDGFVDVDSFVFTDTPPAVQTPSVAFEYTGTDAAVDSEIDAGQCQIPSLCLTMP